MGRILVEISVALFAVFGFCCALKTFLELILAPRQIAVAVEVRNKRDADMLDMLLHEARSAFFQRGRTRLVVLVSAHLMDGTVGVGDELLEAYADLIDSFGAECYLVEM